MKSHLDFYCQEFISEWDDEFAELITVSDLSDIKEHKLMILRELYNVQEMLFLGVSQGEYSIEDLETLTKTILWLVQL